jgi:hypothetical protein
MIRQDIGGHKENEGRTRHAGQGLCLSVAVLSLWLSASAPAAKYAGGSGTQQAPFLISTAEDFQAIGENPADWDKHFRLTQDIDLSDYNEVSLHTIGRWISYASPSNQPFKGEFDGNGKTISHFTHKDLQEEYVGLFPYVAGDIKNLKLVQATVVGNKSGAGALVGYLEKGNLTDCSATKVSVSGNSRVGGLAGSVEGSVTRSYSDGSVSGIQYVGGLLGSFAGVIVTGSYSKAQVAGTESVGGLIGATLKQESLVSSCYALGDVKGSLYVGGLVGQVSAGQVFRCYSAGKVTGTQAAGGLVGYQRALAVVIGSLWDMQTSKQTKSVGGTGKTTAEMKTMDTFLAANWDFFNVWTICEGINYPVLLWQIPPGDLSCPDGVNFLDFVWFAANWRHRDCGALNSNCNGADLDLSGRVEFRDLAIFAENWLAGVE